MSIREIFFAVLIILSGTLAEAGQKRALLWGGGCNDDVDFRTSANQLAGALRGNSSHWIVTNSVADKNADKGSALGSKATLLSFLDDAIANGRKDDEIFLAINAHGDGETDGVSNGWVLPDCTILRTSEPEVQRRFKQLKAKGLKLAIQDESCFSGGSIHSLGKDNCVISSQNFRNPSTGSPLSDSLSRLIKGNKGNVSVADVYKSYYQETTEKDSIFESDTPQISGIPEFAPDYGAKFPGMTGPDELKTSNTCQLFQNEPEVKKIATLLSQFKGAELIKNQFKLDLNEILTALKNGLNLKFIWDDMGAADNLPTTLADLSTLYKAADDLPIQRKALEDSLKRSLSQSLTEAEALSAVKNIPIPEEDEKKILQKLTSDEQNAYKLTKDKIFKLNDSAGRLGFFIDLAAHAVIRSANIYIKTNMNQFIKASLDDQNNSKEFQQCKDFVF